MKINRSKKIKFIVCLVLILGLFANQAFSDWGSAPQASAPAPSAPAVPVTQVQAQVQNQAPQSGAPAAPLPAVDNPLQPSASQIIIIDPFPDPITPKPHPYPTQIELQALAKINDIANFQGATGGGDLTNQSARTYLFSTYAAGEVRLNVCSETGAGCVDLLIQVIKPGAPTTNPLVDTDGELEITAVSGGAFVNRPFIRGKGILRVEQGSEFRITIDPFLIVADASDTLEQDLLHPSGIERKQFKKLDKASGVVFAVATPKPIGFNYEFATFNQVGKIISFTVAGAAGGTKTFTIKLVPKTLFNSQPITIAPSDPKFQNNHEYQVAVNSSFMIYLIGSEYISNVTVIQSPSSGILHQMKFGGASLTLEKGANNTNHVVRITEGGREIATFTGVISYSTTSSQLSVTTSEGKKIVFNSNGTYVITEQVTAYYRVPNGAEAALSLERIQTYQLVKVGSDYQFQLTGEIHKNQGSVIQERYNLVYNASGYLTSQKIKRSVGNITMLIEVTYSGVKGQLVSSPLDMRITLLRKFPPLNQVYKSLPTEPIFLGPQPAPSYRPDISGLISRVYGNFLGLSGGAVDGYSLFLTEQSQGRIRRCSRNMTCGNI